MSLRPLSSIIFAGLTSAAVLCSSVAFAVGTAPTPSPAPTAGASGGGYGGSHKAKTSCSKYGKSTAAYKKCRKAAGYAMNNEELYAAGYQLAKAGDYQGALEFLNDGTDKNDTRFLTMIGYSTRKLGKVDEGMAFYAQALAIDPNSVTTREYLGEAYLQKKDVSSAKAQLVEIQNRCGTTCESFTELNTKIDEYQSGL